MNKKVLYVGVTSDLTGRIWQHKNKVVEGFTQKHHVNRLVYFELHSSMVEAILKEKRLKRWRRVWKDKLISDFNPKWKDLSSELY
ncbi:GIY-YIG nuclease family protein [Vibrio ishigakensis]|uniref:GIY-YIG nuclease family protein n=1 Tax=Vibrio ishigakensis TaxID=1481914 RepID=UPI002905628C|nr:GIY-YIG nuclease family protein [Vibrio ishigakensis]